jgi:acyl carrier protein
MCARASIPKQPAVRGEVREMEDTFRRVTEVFWDVFNDHDLVISPETSAKDISAWDSIMHVSLIITIEKEFGVRMTSAEVARLQTAGDLVDLIESKARP